jgi:hypothetical protein
MLRYIPRESHHTEGPLFRRALATPTLERSEPEARATLRQRLAVYRPRHGHFRRAIQVPDQCRRRRDTGPDRAGSGLKPNGNRPPRQGRRLPRPGAERHARLPPAFASLPCHPKGDFYVYY